MAEFNIRAVTTAYNSTVIRLLCEKGYMDLADVCFVRRVIWIWLQD